MKGQMSSKVFLKFREIHSISKYGGWVLGAHTCNPSYLGGGDWEDYSSTSAQENSS
jgi:hypothetical protein